MNDRSSIASVRTRPIARYYLLFFVMVVVSNLVIKHDAFWDHVRKPYCALLARGCGQLLTWTGTSANVDEFTIAAPLPEIQIVRGCDGLEPLTFLVAAILAFPATGRSRMIGIAVGAPFVFMMNMARIVSLVFLEIHLPWAFEMVHVYVFQVFIIAAAVGFFIWWARATARERLVGRTPALDIRP